MKNVDINSSEVLDLHREILSEKKILREVFTEFYDLCSTLDQENFKGTGLKVEIGSGSSFFKSLYPQIISSDIKNSKTLDMVVDATNMPFDNNSVRSLYCINCFHHFPDPSQFFVELERVLLPGGGCIIIDPYYGWLAKQFYSRLFATEHFNKNQKSWTQDNKDLGVMTGANQALSYLIFIRDNERFESEYPRLKITRQCILNNYPRYILSGGLNFRQLIPNWSLPIIKLIEKLLIPFNKFFGLHHVLVIQKKPQ